VTRLRGGVTALRRALAVTLGALFLVGMVAAAGHTHKDDRESARCALCAIAHSAAVETSATQDAPNLEFDPVGCLVGPDRAPDRPASASNTSRAPPLA
jgi:hypothetical protein